MAENALPASQSPSKTLDIHYRRLDRERSNLDADISLAQLLREALNSSISGQRVADNVQLRVQDNIPGKAGDIRCWNNIIAEQGFIFGTLCLYRPNELMAVIGSRLAQTSLNAYPLSQIDTIENRDFLKSIAYWMAVKDHFYLIQSTSIKTSIIESYFSWLLHRCDKISNDKEIKLQVELDRDAVGGDLNDLESISIGGHVLAPTSDNGLASGSDNSSAPAEALQEKETRRSVGGKSLLINPMKLFEVFTDHRGIEAIRKAYDELQQEDPKATMDAELEFFVRSRKRTESAAAARQRALKALSSGIRDLPSEAVTARAKSGTVTGNDIRLKMPRNISLAPPPETVAPEARSTLLDLNDAFRQMQVVHRRLLEDGKINE